MADYRIYLIDEAGHVQRAMDLQAESDAEAMAAARDRAAGQRHEVWSGTRLVGEAAGRRRQA